MRFCVQDVYEIDNEKIIVGKVLSSILKQGQEVILMPSLEKIKIRFIKVFPKNIKQACQGMCVGLILEATSKIKRGNIIVQKENYPQAINYFKANIFWLSSEPLLINRRLTLRCSTQEVVCIAEKIEKRMDSSTLQIIEENAQELQTNDSAFVSFKTESPILIEKFSDIEELGRFIIEEKRNPQGMGIVV
jgi:sulfate adenylyltransferase subunit 1 (EFTu-like GTPase family)